MIFNRPDGSKTNFLYQWDSGVTAELEISGASDTAISVIYAIAGMTEGLSRECTVSEGHCTAEVPDVLLTAGRCIRAWVVAGSDDNRRVLQEYQIDVRPSARPMDYTGPEISPDGHFTSVAEEIQKLTDGKIGYIEVSGTELILYTDSAKTHRVGTLELPMPEDGASKDIVMVNEPPTSNTKIQVNFNGGTYEVPTMEEFNALLRRVEALERR